MTNCDCHYESIDRPGFEVTPIIVDLDDYSLGPVLRMYIEHANCMTRFGIYICVRCGIGLYIKRDWTILWFQTVPQVVSAELREGRVQAGV